MRRFGKARFHKRIAALRESLQEGREKVAREREKAKSQRNAQRDPSTPKRAWSSVHLAQNTDLKKKATLPRKPHDS